MKIDQTLFFKLLVLFSGVLNILRYIVHDWQTKSSSSFHERTEVCHCQASSGPQWADGRSSSLQILYCVEMQMGWGPVMSSSSHLLQVNRLCVLPLSLSVGTSRWQLLKREPRGGGGVRISPTRCVSSMLICHPLNLYCSSTGSISHIDGTLVLLGLGSSSQTKKKEEEKQRQQRWLLKLQLFSRRVVTLDQFLSSSVFSRLLCPRGHPSVSTPLRYLHLKGWLHEAHIIIFTSLFNLCFPSLPFASKFQLHFPLLYIWSVWLPPIHNDSQCLLKSCLLTPI